MNLLVSKLLVGQASFASSSCVEDVRICRHAFPTLLHNTLWVLDQPTKPPFGEDSGVGATAITEIAMGSISKRLPRAPRPPVNRSGQASRSKRANISELASTSLASAASCSLSFCPARRWLGANLKHAHTTQSLSENLQKMIMAVVDRIGNILLACSFPEMVYVVRLALVPATRRVQLVFVLFRSALQSILLFCSYAAGLNALLPG